MAGIAIYSLYGLAHGLGLPFVSPPVVSELFLWFVVVGIIVFPVALVNAIAGRIATVRARHIALLIGLGIATALLSEVCFQWCMASLSPELNWHRAWLLPTAASLAAFILAALPFGNPPEPKSAE